MSTPELIKKDGFSLTFEPQLVELYKNAFPLHERRTPEALKALLIENEKAMFFQINDGETFIGLVIVWNCDDFIFIEHLAIASKHQNKGWGSRVILLIKETFHLPVLLEVEPPNDEISTKRLKFYHRNGFQVVEKNYLQPAYHANSPDVALWLMSSEPLFSPNKLSKTIKSIHSTVYNR